jgi:uncharacterized RDD family membrane protein YckC
MSESLTSGGDSVTVNSGALAQGLRLRRLAATLIDLLFLAPTALFIMLVTGIVESAEAWVMPQPLIRLALLIVGSYLVLNGYLLFSAGQTLGKRLTGLKIQTRDGGSLPAGRLLIRLYLVPLVAVPFALWLDPVFLPGLYLLNVLFIFAPAERCGHDYLAASRVVRVAR